MTRSHGRDPGHAPESGLSVAAAFDRRADGKRGALRGGVRPMDPDSGRLRPDDSVPRSGDRSHWQLTNETYFHWVGRHLPSKSSARSIAGRSPP